MLTYRSGLGRPLTADEADGNISDLDGRVTNLEDNPPTPDNIAEIQVNGNQMTIIMQSYDTFGPFTIPTTVFRFRGEWVPSTVFAAADVFSNAGALYLTQVSHETAETFDPEASSTDGPLYQLMLAAPPIPADIVLNYQGLIGFASNPLIVYVAPRGTSIAVDFLESQAVCITPPAGEFGMVLPITIESVGNDPALVGTLTFPQDSQLGVFAGASPSEVITLTAGQFLVIREPDTEDGAASDLSVTIVATSG